MIGRVVGPLVDIDDNLITLDINGLGYEIMCSQSVLGQPNMQEGALIEVWTHFVVREDAQLLFGFAEKKERSLFRELIKISGIGPKVALALLSGLSVDQLILAARAADSSALTVIPGIGKKTAERILIEMRDRLKDWSLEHSPSPDVLKAPGTGLAGNAIAEAESALIALGYKPTEATKMLSSLEPDDTATVEELIRHALQSKNR